MKTASARHVPAHLVRGFEFVDAALRQDRPDFRRRMAHKAVETDPSNPYAHAFLGLQTLDAGEALVSYVVAGRLAATWRHSSSLDAPYRPALSLALAARDLMSGEPDRALARLRPSLETPHLTAGVVVETRRVLLSAAAACGDVRSFREALAATDPAFMPLETPWLAFLQAAQVEHPDADCLWRKAQAIAPGVGAPTTPRETFVNVAYRLGSKPTREGVLVARACVMPCFLSVEGAGDRG